MNLCLRHRRLRHARLPPVLEAKPDKERRENKDDEPAFLARQLEHQPFNLNHRTPSGKLRLGIAGPAHGDRCLRQGAAVLGMGACIPGGACRTEAAVEPDIVS